MARHLAAVARTREQQVVQALEAALNQRRVGLLDLISPGVVPSQVPDRRNRSRYWRWRTTCSRQARPPTTIICCLRKEALMSNASRFHWTRCVFWPATFYTQEFPVERFYRDAPLMIIGDGTNEIFSHW